MAKIFPPRSCAQCGTEIFPKKGNKRFCSQKCSRASWLALNGQYGREKSKEWYWAHREQVSEKRKKPPKQPSARTCQNCGLEFQAVSSARRFCTPKCNRSWYMSQDDNRLRKNAIHNIWCHKNSKRVCEHQKKYNRAETERYPWVPLVKRSKARAKKRGIPHTLTNEWGAGRWTGLCELTGLPFTEPSKRRGHNNRSYFPTIDRINPSLGYTQENCRFVLWAVNSLKGDNPDHDMYHIAKALIERAKTDQERPSPRAQPEQSLPEPSDHTDSICDPAAHMLSACA